MKTRSRATIFLLVIAITSVISLVLTSAAIFRRSTRSSDAQVLRKSKESQIPPSPSPSKVAIFFESENNKPEDIAIVVKFMELLPDWKFQLFLTETSREQFQTNEKIESGISAGRVIVTILPPFDKTWYMRAQINVTFWEDFVLGDLVLLFHPDSMICKESPHRIEEFFK